MGGRFEDRLEDREYLGDGVYAGHDGHHVVTWMEDTGAFGPDAIAMTPEVLEALDRYRDRIEGDPEPDIEPGDKVRFTGSCASALGDNPGRAVEVGDGSAKVRILYPHEAMGNEFEPGEHYWFGIENLEVVDDD